MFIALAALLVLDAAAAMVDEVGREVLATPTAAEVLVTPATAAALDVAEAAAKVDGAGTSAAVLDVTSRAEDAVEEAAGLAGARGTGEVVVVIVVVARAAVRPVLETAA